MGTEFRVFIRILLETFRNIKRANLMNWVVISTMAAILSIFGCMFRLTVGIDNIVKEFGSVLKISVYLQDDINPREFINSIKSLPNIKEIEFVDKDKAWKDLKKEYVVPDISNPLPNTLHVRVIKSEDIEPMVEKLKKTDGVESVNYAQWIAQQMKKLSRATTIATLILVLLLGGLTLFIISNTIHLLIQSCSTEIEIMNIMGVSPWYIKTPYILQGAFYGLAGSLIALIPLYILQGYIVKIYQYFNLASPAINLNIVILAILLIGILVGSGGSLISVQRFLKI